MESVVCYNWGPTVMAFKVSYINRLKMNITDFNILLIIYNLFIPLIIYDEKFLFETFSNTT